MPVDWVYRPIKYDLLSEDINTAPAPEDTYSGTYYCPINMTSGAEGSTAQVLYDSAQYTSARLALDLPAASGAPRREVVPAEARPDMNRKGALIHGVELGIYMHVEASVWTGAAHLFMGWRIIVCRQDQDDGRALIDPSYSLWTNTTGFPSDEPSVFANGRENCAEGKYFKARQTSDNYVDAFIHRPFVRFKRRLEYHEGLFLYLELHPNSVALTNQSFVNLWCRTLVTDTNR